MLQTIVFYIFASALIISSLGVILVRNSVHSALFLVLAFFSTAALWILLEAEFLALILVLVYVGAVMTLFLFVVMMLNVDTEASRSGFVRYLPFALIVAGLMFGALIMAIGPQYFGPGKILVPLAKPENFSNIAALGSVLYTDYALPFEMAGCLLLIAILTAVMLTLRPPRARKQLSKQQIQTERSQHVRLVSLKSEWEETK